MTAPTWGDIVPLMGEAADLPAADSPYYVYAKEGTFLHRKLAFGRGLVRWYKDTPKLKAVGNKDGIFWFDDDNRLPTTITAQAVHFFRRIFEKHHTEAEVIITQNIETREYKLYVPTQRVSHGGVYSIYNPATIAKGWLVVGTMHSHCDFGAYHSGTDEGDARDMDGLHLTIGHVPDEKPEVAAMVAMNKTFYHYKDPDVVADFSDLSAASAPEWWDRYVVLGIVTDDQRPDWADDETWDRYMGRYKPAKPAYTVPTYPVTTYQRGIEWGEFGELDNWRQWTPQVSKESEEFNKRRLRLLGFDTTRQSAVNDAGDEFWEDRLGKAAVDALFDSGVFSEEDIDMAMSEPESGSLDFWVREYITRLQGVADFLRFAGLDVSYSVGPKRKQKIPNNQLELLP